MLCCYVHCCFSCALRQTAKYKTQCPNCKRELNQKQTVFTVSQEDLVRLVTQIEIGLLNAKHSLRRLTVYELLRAELYESAAPSPIEMPMQEDPPTQPLQDF